MSDFDQARLIELAVLLAVITTTIGFTRARMRLLGELSLIPDWIVSVLLISLGAGVSSAMRSVLPWLAGIEVAHTVIWVLATLAGAALLGERRLWPLVDLIFLALPLILFIHVVIGVYAGAISGQPELMKDWWLPMSNPRFVSQSLVWCVPWLCIGGASAGIGLRSLRAGACVGGAIAGIFLLALAGGRGAIGGLLVASCVLVWTIYRGDKDFWVPRQLLGAACAGVGLYLIWQALVGDAAYAGERLVRGGLSWRDILWTRAIAMIRAEPVLGVGPGHYAVFDGTGFMTAHPHSLPLQFACEWGLPAAIGICAVIFGLLWRFARRLRQVSACADDGRGRCQQALFVSCVAAALLSLVDGVLVMPWSLTLGFLVVSLTMAGFRPSAGVVSAAQERRIVAFVMLAVISAGVLMAGVIRTWPVAGVMGGSTVYEPRFWLDGQLSSPPVTELP